MYVDSHCHLDYSDYADDFDQVLKRAQQAGVKCCLTICTKMSRANEVYAITDRAPWIYATVGVHPHEADHEAPVSSDTLTEWARKPKIVGLGETGLDYYYEHSQREHQRSSFLAHIHAAQKTGLPLVVHTRDAEEDTWRVLNEEYQKRPFRGVIHCFTSSLDFANLAMGLGMYISISGIVTFKNAITLQDAVRQIPIERMLIETDAPYLAPMPHRGKRNEPSFVGHTAQKIAELKNMDVKDVARITTQNFFSLFNKVDSLPS